MGIIKRTAADAMKDAATMASKAADFEAKTAEATATAQRMDAESLDALVDNPGQAEGISGKIDAQERLARAYQLKATEHRGKVPGYHHEALELEAAAIDREADKLERDAAQQAEKVADALAKLEALDGGCKYAPARIPSSGYSNESAATFVPKAVVMREQVQVLRAKAAHNRYYLQNGRMAHDRYELNPMLSEPFSTLAGMWLPEGTTSDLLAAIANGTVPETEAA
jgi:hypothetical protein